MGLRFSIEVLPPQVNEPSPFDAWNTLSTLGPEFVTIAALPGRMPAPAAVGLCQPHFEAPCAPTLTCRDTARAAMPSILDRLRHAGIHHVIVVRGDASSDTPAPFDYPHSLELVRAVREGWRGTLRIDAGAHPEGHPQGRGPARELDWLLAKLDAGADGLITQFLFDPAPVVKLRDRLAARGREVALRPSVLVCRDPALLSRLATSSGVKLPTVFRKALAADRAGGDGGHHLLEETARLRKQLVAEGFDSLHLYSMNDADGAAIVVGG